ncbi:MAG: hypothetical protein HZC24_04275 [Rhodocyclales bacterium]|nr:hypothetical protein [Rhodocyclales bacterium]
MRQLAPPGPQHGRHRRRPGLPLGVACAAWIGIASAQTPAAPVVEQPETPVAFEAVTPGPPSSVSPAAVPKSENLPDLAAVAGWGIPPIRWGGNTTSNYGWNESAAGATTFTETQTVGLRGSSYIYQPWYAQVSGDLGLLTGTSKQSGGDSVESNSSRSTSLTYGGNLNLFPQSRFPFQAYVQSSDSRASANAMGSHYTALRMGARQSYRPETGPETYSASADRSIVATSDVRSVVDALQGGFATSIAEHGISANARYSRNSGDVGGQGSSLLSLNAAHSWHSDEELTVASSANFTNNQIRMLTGGGLSINDSQVVQLGSSVTWLPDEDLPLTVIGGGSFLRMNTMTETASADLSNLTGYANASYRFSNNFSANAGLTVAQNQSAGIRQVAAGQSASVSYSGNPLTFGDYSYNWGTGAGISNQMITGAAANRNLSGQVQHSVLRNLALGEASAIVLNATQSYALAYNSTSGQSGVLTHGAGASWRRGIGQQSLGMLSTTLSDSISTGDYPSHYRSLSTQGTMQTQFSSRSTLSANVNFVLSQQLSSPQISQTATGATPTSALVSRDGSSTLNGSAQISYTHRSPFDIPDLVYSAAFQANASQTNLRLISGDPNALAWQTGQVFQQYADYRLGRLMFRATNSFATLNGKKNASIFFTISREIGDF